MRQPKPKEAATATGEPEKGNPRREADLEGPSSSQEWDGMESRRLGMWSSERGPMESVRQVEEALLGSVDV